uniref:Uncharacterized protein n=1 Tax=Phyllostachys edulis TaxID=38705 RepID=D3IVL2_PHYED|nr:hypothetical protein [Phyllostachys edulis]
MSLLSPNSSESLQYGGKGLSHQQLGVSHPILRMKTGEELAEATSLQVGLLTYTAGAGPADIQPHRVELTANRNQLLVEGVHGGILLLERLLLPKSGKVQGLALRLVVGMKTIPHLLGGRQPKHIGRVPGLNAGYHDGGGLSILIIPHLVGVELHLVLLERLLKGSNCSPLNILSSISRESGLGWRGGEGWARPLASKVDPQSLSPQVNPHVLDKLTVVDTVEGDRRLRNRDGTRALEVLEGAILCDGRCQSLIRGQQLSSSRSGKVMAPASGNSRGRAAGVAMPSGSRGSGLQQQGLRWHPPKAEAAQEGVAARAEERA